MKSVPFLARIEFWVEAEQRWHLAYAGINLLDPARYVDRLAAGGQIARATILGQHLEALNVITSHQATAPSETDDEAWEVDDREVLADGFIPALSKLEAVNRLSALAGGGVEVLGPGSKERKSVLDSLAKALELNGQVLSLRKIELAGLLARRLSEPWGEACYSSGETVTLVGLNTLLHGAERQISKSDVLASPLDEARRMADVISSVLRRYPRFGLKEAVTQMRLEEARQWRQSQWVGWYFEHIALPPCFGAIGGRPIKSPTATFDFSASHIWDFKTHSDHGAIAPLNDAVATHWALDQGGLGFVVLTGDAEFEPWAKPWLDEQKALYPSSSRRKKERKKDRSSRIKSAFTPSRVDFFYFQSQSEWREAAASGVVKGFQENWKQYDGETPRSAKYSLNVDKAVASQNALLSVGLPH
ncbi:hypothetical protein FE634_12495 [Nocardioides dongxiaopingii]|uniref:hypothetical protein n=1 Tax=Nocardioides sp. S-1144 TaxID=2582905 RepID=UPI00110EBC18|nr:hypothetical protein [Nocardioides sp. S-1144]QCW51015.1 hypothetical protein FE634_12495 [Nocardioides sp. S-1144]